MRQALALLLLCSLSVHCAGRLGIVARWWLDRDYIARELCVNRARPQLRCNGKCQLAKRLHVQAAKENQQQPGDGQRAFQEIVLFCAPLGVALPEPLVLAAPAPRYAAFCAARYAWDRPGPDHPPAEG